MRERRRYRRARSIFDLKIVKRDTLTVIGYLLDVSAGGVGMISDEPVQAGDLLRLELVVPLGEQIEDRIAFEARAMWCEKAEEAQL